MLLTFTTLFIFALMFGSLLQATPEGASWRIGGFARINRLRRLLGGVGLIISVSLLMILVSLMDSASILSF